MDPSLMKKLLEDDEDEIMHSRAEVEAFQAALNRDIEGDVSASQRSESDSAALCQGSNNTSSQLSTAIQDENTAGQIKQEQKIVQHREMQSYEMELRQQGSVAANMEQKYDFSQEQNNFPMPQKQQLGDLQQEQAEQKTPETSAMPISERKLSSAQEQGITPNLESESQYLKLQKMSSQQSMTMEKPGNPLNHSKSVPFGQLIPLLLPQLDKDRGTQLTTLFRSLKRNQIRRDAFVRKLKGIVGEEMLKMAVMKVQLQPGPKHQLPPPASVQQQSSRMLSISAGATQLNDPRSFVPHLRGANSPTDQSQIPLSAVQVKTDSSHPVIENTARKFPEAECHSDSQEMQVSQRSSSSAVALDQEWDGSSVPMKVFDKSQQQQLHYPPSPFPMSGNTGGTLHLYSGTTDNACALPIKLQPLDAQLRQIPQHQTSGSAKSGGETQRTNIMSVSKMARQNSMIDPCRLQGGSFSHFSNNSTLQQNPVRSQSSNKEQSSGPSSMAYVKQEPIDQTSVQQHKPTLPKSQGLPASTAQLEKGNASSKISMDESSENQSSGMGVSKSVSVVPSSSTSTVSPNSVSSSSITMQVGPGVLLGPQKTSGTSPSVINNSKPPLKKPYISQKKPLEALGSSPTHSSKKQKVCGIFSDMEQLNDVTAVSGVNLREEEEQLFSGPKEDSRASEASRKAVQEEEERLILQKAPLQKKIAEIGVKCGLKSVSHGVERCLSLCVEERMRGLINNLIRLSKQRADAEKSGHHTITTSDVRQQIMDLNRKSQDEWEKKQAEAEKLRRLNEPEVENGGNGDKEKDEGRPKSLKTNKEENEKMRTTAANVAARAAVGGDDMLSKWQLMAQARQKREGDINAVSGSEPWKDLHRYPPSTAGRIMQDIQEAEKRGSAAGAIRKSGRNQVIMPQTRMARTRSISVKDVIAVLEREPQMSKSVLIYRLHERIQ